MGWENFIVSIVVPLVASAIGGFIAIYSADRSVNQTLIAQEERDDKQHNDLIQGVLQAICEELSVNYGQINLESLKKTWERFEDHKQLWQQNKDPKDRPYFSSHFPIPQDCFVIYRSNANFIGQINRPSNLPGRIVYSYNLLQALIGHFSLNNTFLIEYRKTGNKKALSELQNLGPVLERERDLFNKSVLNLFEILKEEYDIQVSTDYSA